MQEMQSAQEGQENNLPNKVIKSLHNQSIDYESVKKEAIEKSPLVASYPLSSFDLGMNKTIKLNGKLLPIAPQAYNNFLKKVLNVDPQFAKRFKKVTDEKTEMAMLQALKSGITLNKQKQVHILANPQTKEIKAFSAGKHTFRTNEALLSIFENVMNSYPTLELKDFYMMDDGTMNLSARSNDQIAGSLSKTEIFNGGLTFRNSYEGGSFIGHNALRLVCENGMFGFSDLPLFVGPTEGHLIKFFEKLDELNVNKWIDGSFWDKLNDAMNLNASVYELKTAKSIMMNNSMMKENDLRHYLPEYNSAHSWLKKRNVNMDILSPAQEHNCPTNINLWQLINQITDFGSHNYGYDTDFGAVQKRAGVLFAKQPDVKDLVIFS